MGIDLQIYYRRTLSLKVFKHMCFKHFKESKYYNGSSYNDSFTEKKRKAWNRGKRTQTPFTITEGLAATSKVYGCWLFLQGSPVTDV